jgi:hypothetical protein
MVVEDSKMEEFRGSRPSERGSWTNGKCECRVRDEGEDIWEAERRDPDGGEINF